MIYNKQYEDQKSTILILMNSHECNDNIQKKEILHKSFKLHTQTKLLSLKVKGKKLYNK
jgi:hypothetical protein